MNARFLGLDLAWSDRNRSGACALDAGGRILDLRSDLTGDDEIVAWCRRWKGDRGAIALDMPTIVRGPAGTSRPCERALARDFGRQHAGPYPANLGRFPDGGRAARMLRALRTDGVVETIAIAPHDPRTVAFEAFPHAAAVRLFELDRVLPYKKKRRPWPVVLEAWAFYRAALASLDGADPPLIIDERVLPERVTQHHYKRWDDAIDGVLCAYIAAWVWRWGTQDERVKVYGDMELGHIVVPNRAANERPAFAPPAGGERLQPHPTSS